MALLALVVVLALAGAFGPRDGSVTTQAADGSELTVRYPKLTRPGLDTEVEVQWSSAQRLTDSLVVIVDQTMFSDLGIELVMPEPSTQRSAGGRVYMSFDAPDHRQFTVLFSGRLPTRATSGSHRFSVAIDGVTDARAGARTWVLP